MAPPPPPPSMVNLEAARSVAHRPLPPFPPDLDPDAVTICLFYQYKEPPWNPKQHRKILSKVIALADAHSITGRGRCAPEGLNCTLTGSAQQMRDFCLALRDHDCSLFGETDFKLTDGLDPSKRFRSFSLRKTDELVNYGLDGVRAPSIARHGGLHLDADEYHEALRDPNAVVVDVRNRYESEIGHFQPPPGGATLLDPNMRNSSDFPRWLNAPETREKLHGKKVMMYCTGGIRCERATALLNQMTETAASSSSAASFDGGKTQEPFRTDGPVVMVRGGIERYLKTFPGGGYWSGKNYLFDRRMEQVPESKPTHEVEAEATSNTGAKCCVCLRPYSSYLGQFKCGGADCGVPVIVCPGRRCRESASESPQSLACPLCREGYRAPTVSPDLIGQKRALGLLPNHPANADNDCGDAVLGSTRSEGSDDSKPRANEASVGGKTAKRLSRTIPSTRLFVGRLPLVITASALRRSLTDAIGPTGKDARDPDSAVAAIEWIVDRDTGAYYGSAWLSVSSLDDAVRLVGLCEENGGVRLITTASKGAGVGTVSKTISKKNGKQQKKKKGLVEKHVPQHRRKKMRIAYAPLRDGESWPLPGHEDREYPPLGW